MRRVNRITEESVEEAKFEAKYGVEVVRDKKTGEIKLNKRPPNEIDERLKQNAIDAKRKGKTATASVVIPAEERKKLAKAMLLEKKKQKESESTKASVIDEFKRDEIKFGEVVKAPPHLSVPRLAKKAETVPRVSKHRAFQKRSNVFNKIQLHFFFSRDENHFFYTLSSMNIQIKMMAIKPPERQRQQRRPQRNNRQMVYITSLKCYH